MLKINQKKAYIREELTAQKSKFLKDKGEEYKVIKYKRGVMEKMGC